MIGAAIIVVVVVIAIPVAVMMSGSIGAALLGFFVQKDVDERHADSELIDLNS